MREKHPPNGFEIELFQTPNNEEEEEEEEEEDDINNRGETEIEPSNGRRSRVSGSRRTRSQVAPDWTVQESTILVNEIDAVERDCQKSLSSYQKWKIIVENCNALGVRRSLNQCRVKWDELVCDYNKIKKWESYFDLDIEKRKRELRVCDDFDAELFHVIDDHFRAQDGFSDTDPDSDPEARVDVLDVIPETGSKKQKRKAVDKRCSIQKRAKAEKHTKKIPLERESTEEKVKSRKSRVEEVEKITEQCNREAKVKPVKVKHKCEEKMKSEKMSIEDKDQMMATELRENVELINNILDGNLSEEEDYLLTDLRNVEASHTNFVRSQGNKLISCFENLVNTLDQLRDLVQERD